MHVPTWAAFLCCATTHSWHPWLHKKERATTRRSTNQCIAQNRGATPTHHTVVAQRKRGLPARAFAAMAAVTSVTVLMPNKYHREVIKVTGRMTMLKVTVHGTKEGEGTRVLSAIIGVASGRAGWGCVARSSTGSDAPTAVAKGSYAGLRRTIAAFGCRWPDSAVCCVRGSECH